MLDYQALNRWLDAKKTGLHHRQLLIIELPIEETTPILKTICEHYKEVTAVITEFSNFKGTSNVPMARYQDYLGSQTDALVFDATCGVQLNALYAGAGMVRANGLVVVLLEPNNVNSTSKNRFKFSYGQQPSHSYFNELFKDRIQKFNGCIISQTVSFFRSSEIETTAETVYALRDNLREIETSTTLDNKDMQKVASETQYNNELSCVQSEIAEKITSNIANNKSHSHSISIILGARGRGKSTLLGAIGARLKHLSNTALHTYEIATTALHRNQLGAVNQAFSLHSQQIAKNKVSDTSNNKSFEGTLSFYSPDEIISLASNDAVILIDEVSSIAPELLKNIVTHFSHVVIAGTVSGYEGSGNGFLKRVLPYIQTLKKTCVYELTKPFRWLENDPIEACFTDILSNEPLPELHSQNRALQSELGNINFSLVQKHELINNEDLYHQLFSLLTQAHYQTTPNDIVRTLDAQECKIFIAQNNCTISEHLRPVIIAVAVVFEEGGTILEPLASDISLGIRRVQGHLTAQALSMQLFSPEICLNSYLRVNRIAVHSQYTRKGVASRLLAYCEQYAIQHQIDYMSVSFGYTHWLYKFWRHNRYLLAKIGHRIDTASGTASLLMLKPLSKTGSIDFATLSDRITLDVDYYSRINKRLANLFKELIKEETIDSQCADVNTELLEYFLQLYKNKQINFQKVAPALLHIIKLSALKLNSEKQKTLYDMFIRLHQKGVHKEEKQYLETKLFFELSKR